MCVHWSRTMQPGNRGWPSSWSRWWPWWVWRAEDHTSQGALGRDPIRNRAVPERRLVPIFFSSCDFLPLPFKDNFFLGLFLLPLAQEIFWFPHPPLLHWLVYLKEGWFGAEVVSPTVQCGWDPSALAQGELQGLNAWMLAILAYSPLLEEKRGGKQVLCCLQEFTLIDNSLKTMTLGVHFVENFFQE